MGRTHYHQTTAVRRRWGALCLVVMAIALNPVFTMAAEKKITITVGGEGMHYFPVYLARGAGLFAEEGLDVEWVVVGSGTRQAASVMGASAQMSPLALTHVLKSGAKGANLVAFASVFASWANFLVLSNEAIQKTGITREMAIGEKVKRLRGLKIAITSPGSSTDEFIRKLFVARNMDPDKEVSLQPMGSGASMLAAFEKKLTDGLVFPSPIPELAEKKRLGRIVIDPFSGEVPELRNVPFVVMATSRETLRDKSDVIQAATRALTKAMVYARERPQETKKVIRGYFKELDEDVFNIVVETYRNATPSTPLISEEQVARTADWMNLGEKERISVSYSNVVAVEPARSVAAALLK